MPSDEKKSDPPMVAAETTADTAPPRVFASRTDWLDAAGKFAEEEFHLDGIGWVILSEISASARADILGHMASAMIPQDAAPGEAPAVKAKLDTPVYQRKLLLAGVVDSTSAPGARLPLFKEGDMDRVMKVGGSKVAGALDVIERLSNLGRYQPSAEGNSATTPSAASTTG